MRPFLESFEHYSATSQLAGKWDEFQGTLITAVDGRQWFRLSGLSANQLVKSVSLDTPNQILIGFAIIPSDSASGPTQDIFYLRDGGTEMLSVWLVEGTLTVRRGNTIILTATESIPSQTRSYIEIRAVMHNSAGSVDLQINGAPAGSFAGDTINSGSTLTNVRWGGQDQTVSYRDIYITEYGDFWGEIVVRALHPNGVGGSSDWTPSGAGDNYEMVNQATPDDDTYVASNTDGDRDLYQFEDPEVSTDSRIHAVQAVVRGRRVDGGGATLRLLAASGGSEEASDSHALSDMIRYHTSTFVTNPATGQPWTIQELATAQFGFELDAEES